MTSTGTRRPRLIPRAPWRGRGVAGGFAALVLALSALVAGPSTAQTSSGSIEVVRTFTPVTMNPHYIEDVNNPYAWLVRLHIDEVSRTLYTIDSMSPSFVAAYDLDTLKPRGEGLLATGGNRHAMTVLEDQGWLVVATGNRGTTTIEVLKSAAAGIESVGTVGVGPGGLGGPDHVAAGLAPVPGTDLVFAVANSGANLVGGTTTVSLIDLADIANGGGEVLWTAPITNCLLPARLGSMPSAIGWVQESASVYIACSDASIILDTVAKPPLPAGIGRLHIEDSDGPSDTWSPGPFELYPRAGDFRGRVAIFDPATKRVLASAGNVTAGGTLVAFDTVHNVYVGGLTFGNNALSAIGISSTGGRVYTRAPNHDYGLMAADTATTPLEQGRSFPEHGGATGAQEMIAVDGSTRRVFMPPLSDHSTQPPVRESHWFVLQDHLPHYTAPPVADPDRNTIDLPEAPGVTGRTFSGGAQGYGFRARQVGGTQGLLFNVVPFDASTDAVVSGGTREGRTAYLERIGLTDSEAVADVIAADRDDASTGADQARSGTEWPVEAAMCADFGDGAVDDSADGSQVLCDFANRTVEVASSAGQSTAGGVVVDGATLESAIRLDDEHGLVVEVTATADGIGVPGLLSVGRVTVTTTASAHGRPGTAAGSFSRTVEDVTIAGQVVCTDDCDTNELAKAFNEQFAGRARLAFPEPDPVLAAGSPGGYQTIVQRGHEQQVQAIFDDQQDADRVEVPGMVLYLYQDSSVPAHSLYEFAGTQAEARYGIFALSEQDDPDTERERPNEGGTDEGDSNGPGGGVADDPVLVAPIAGAAEPPDLPGGGGTADPGPIASPGPGALLEEFLSLGLNDPVKALALLPVWALLLSPVYLSSRRALYVRRDRLTPGVAS